MITAIVVDDEPLARDELIYFLRKTERVNILAEAATGPEALALVEQHRPDVVFLDVQMPEMNGFEVATRLLQGAIRPAVIFATAHDEYALRAFDVHALDYLLKPFDGNRVVRAVQRLDGQVQDRSRATLERLESFLGRLGAPRAVLRLPLEKNGRTVLVSPADVLFVSSGETGTLVRTAGEEYRTGYSLQELEERLRPETFVRIHRQYIVNMERVAEFIPWPGGTASLVLDDRARTQLPVARTQVRRVKDLLGMP
ncbi:MAG TPA: response regulator [Symbiobacteriaceae bacterium]|jgi:DNA-binding LytR/AlgR family response regulator